MIVRSKASDTVHIAIAITIVGRKSERCEHVVCAFVPMLCTSWRRPTIRGWGRSIGIQKASSELAQEMACAIEREQTPNILANI
jgi:hypothetical protein